VHAIDMLDTIGRLDLVTPLLLHHESPRVRARAVGALAHADADRADVWLPTVRRMLDDDHPDVRAAALGAVAALRRDEGADLLRRHLDDADPRVAAAASIDLADSDDASDAAVAEATLARLAGDARAEAAGARRHAAAALARIRNRAVHSLLIPLIHDPVEDVAREAIASARTIGVSDALFVPALVSLLGHRRLKTAAREALLGYGADIVPVLAHVMHDRDEPRWVRRHVPRTLAGIPTQEAMDALAAVLDDPDGFLRYKAVVAIENLRRTRPELVLPRDIVLKRIVGETARYYAFLTLRHNIVERDAAHADSLLAGALADKLGRTLDRLFRLLGLLHPWRDIAAARYAIEGVDARARAGGLEYLDNLLAAPVRKRVMPIIDTTPMAEKVRHANSVLRTRPRDVADTVAQLVHEDDPVVAAAAIHFLATSGLTAAMRDDLAFVLSHRQRETLVTQAAEWALAARSGAPAPADAGGLPVVELANRLRAIPLFAFVSVDELFRVAQDARQVRVEPGVLYRQGGPAHEVLFLLDGTVRVSGGPAGASVVRAPAALNLTDVLEGRPIARTLAADAPVVGLILASGDFLTMLADNVAAAQGLFRMLPVSPQALDWAVRGGDAPAWAASAKPDAPMEPVEIATRLRQMPLFSRATVDQLRELTAAAREVPLAAGDALWDDATEPAIYHVLRGEVTVRTTGGPDLPAGAGGTIGVAETLRGASLGRRATVTGVGRALRLDRDALFDVLADHDDLLQHAFSVALDPVHDASDGGDR
jgi:HEAT repeat protein